MGSPLIFDRLKFFRETENWGNPDQMDWNLLIGLDNLRGMIGTPIIISCGTQGEHSPKSKHYAGQAVDVIAPDMHLLDFFLQSTRISEFCGIGIYPDWEYKKFKYGGLHLESGSTYPKKRWIFKDGDFTGVDYKNLKRIGAFKC